VPRCKKLSTTVIQTSQLMAYKVKIAVCSEIRTKHSTQSERHVEFLNVYNPLKPKDLYMSRTAPLTSKRCILYIYSTNVGTEYFKHALYSPFFFLSSKCSLFLNAKCFGSCIIHILCTGVLKLKKNNSRATGLNLWHVKKQIGFKSVNSLTCYGLFAHLRTHCLVS
jgi:hypothetical protein